MVLLKGNFEPFAAGKAFATGTVGNGFDELAIGANLTARKFLGCTRDWRELLAVDRPVGFFAPAAAALDLTKKYVPIPPAINPSPPIIPTVRPTINPV